MHALEATLEVISSDQIVKAIPSRNEDIDVAGICSMVRRNDVSTVARNEDNVCSGIPSPSI
jgi:hypothetical protein